MKLNIFRNLKYSKLKNVVPPCYKSLTPFILDEDGYTYDIVIFPNNKVILSRNVRKAIKKIDNLDGNKKLIIGYCFTLESKTVLNNKDIQYLELNEFHHWTDESYTNVLLK